MDYYDWEFRHGNWHNNKDDPFAELTPILDKAGSALDDITHLNVMREVILGDKKKPVIKIEGEITKNLADIPVPNLMISDEYLHGIKVADEMDKFKPKMYKAVFTDPNGETRVLKVHDINFDRGMVDGITTVTLKGILTDE